ncbi:zinc-dependent alcohol dehydrogenase family protein [Pseudorhodoplanes sinuspersici]|uniref:NAD(P)-dependent alcohol dehydrogenase n=1 Tax=Pseudorhodoplanes sinuspersici TaxID=1235591 RepID=A0A1W6ZQF3_9HYPH|nr:NAD(P)-dependent alcohol dehydrogenase [Pseudorhodoplanes sinuspersici]ARP99638.1 NAD(P)-dependent alcohol dehydrogenase [Pseudorhodoplanes sinuspersici]RKE70612.1 alcohol dehydrogenase [Pseudorhodoplanes sinuspersici]
MKAMVMGGLGLSNLALQDLPDPRPGPGQVLVRLHAASLNYRDLLTLDGKYGSMQRRENLILLSDGAGEIAEIGAGVKEWKVGDRVVGCFFPFWQNGEPQDYLLRDAPGGLADGMACQYRVFNSDAILPIPPQLSFVEAATLPCAALTAWSAVRAAHKTGPEHVVLTQGTGGVSLFALQFAKAAGATVIATSSSEEKLRRLRSLGADHVINYRDDAEWGKTARKLTKGRGVDLVVEVGGAGTIKQSIRATKLGGTIPLIGVVAGPSLDLPLPLITMNLLKVVGVALGNRRQFADMLRAIEHHAIKPVVDRVFPLTELPEALAWLQAGKHVGKVCIEID